MSSLVTSSAARFTSTNGPDIIINNATVHTALVYVDGNEQPPTPYVIACLGFKSDEQPTGNGIITITPGVRPVEPSMKVVWVPYPVSSPIHTKMHHSTDPTSVNLSINYFAADNMYKVASQTLLDGAEINKTGFVFPLHGIKYSSRVSSGGHTHGSKRGSIPDTATVNPFIGT